MRLTHDLISGVVVCISRDLAAVAESDILPRIGSKVKNDLPSLSIRDVQIFGLHWVKSQARIRGKYCHRNLSANRVAGLKVELVRPADASVKEAKAVLARLDLMEWPWNTIDMNDISKYTDLLVVCLWVPETAIGVVPFGGKSKWQIVLFGRKAKIIFLIIRQDVETSLAKVSILGSVVDGVVVIPQGAGILSVRIIVIFVLARFCGIVRPSIEWGTAIRAVKVNTVG